MLDTKASLFELSKCFNLKMFLDKHYVRNDRLIGSPDLKIPCNIRCMAMGKLPVPVLVSTSRLLCTPEKQLGFRVVR